MSSKVKIFVKLGLFLLSVLLSYNVAYYVCETYFFDKVFYQKSVAFGYWPINRKVLITEFGRRAYDVIPLFSSSLSTHIPAWYRASVTPNALKHTYTIAMIGDSYVWGQGVRFSDSVSQVLERKLNTIRKTKVFAIAQNGDDVVENYSKYTYLQHEHIDLFIFVLVNNDILFNLERKYQNDNDKQIYTSMTDACVTAQGVPITGTYFSDQKKGEDYYPTMLLRSYANPSNLCVLDAVAPLLPKRNAIYFDPNNYFEKQDEGMEIYLSALRRQNLFILTSAKGRSISTYSRYFRDPEKYFHVSKLEPHPSVLAHRMYADILFKEIMSNPQWSFMRQ